jgi:hypothetical protein
LRLKSKKETLIIGVPAAEGPNSHFAMDHTKGLHFRRSHLLRKKTKQLIYAHVSILKLPHSVMEHTRAFKVQMLFLDELFLKEISI